MLCLADGCDVPRHSLANSSEVKAEHPAEEIVEDQPAIAKDYKLSQADGGSVRTDPGLGQRFIVNKDSSLRRVWVAVHDNLPLTIDGTPGVTTFYLRSEPYGYRYAASAILIVSPDQDVTAFTMKFLLIDVFSERMTTLSARVIQDIGAGEKKTFNWQWSAGREESNVERYFASVAFIDKVRTIDGQVHQANYAAVLDTLRRFTTEADLFLSDAGLLSVEAALD